MQLYKNKMIKKSIRKSKNTRENVGGGFNIMDRIYKLVF